MDIWFCKKKKLKYIRIIYGLNLVDIMMIVVMMKT
jgi:hypothetical protein